MKEDEKAKQKILDRLQSLKEGIERARPEDVLATMQESIKSGDYVHCQEIEREIIR